MATKSVNRRLHAAKAGKNDEFYTQLTDIEKELKHYKTHFKGKVVLCNCDDPRISNFFKYFALNFKELGLKKLITTCYKSNTPDLFSDKKAEKAVYLEYYGDQEGNMPNLKKVGIKNFKGDGDFRSEECVALLKEADIVVTNPPFSLFREYVQQLIDHKKKFLIVGSQNAITYKETFQLIKENKLWAGVINGGDKWFQVPQNYEIKTDSHIKEEKGVKFFKMRSIYWFTNLTHKKRNEELVLAQRYTPKAYPTFDNYDAINVNKVADIPVDYAGAMGVPITFLDKFNPEQFELLGTSDNGVIDDKYKKTKGLSQKFVDDYYKAGGTGAYKEGNPTAGYYLNGVATMAYKRLFIKNKTLKGKK